MRGQESPDPLGDSASFDAMPEASQFNSGVEASRQALELVSQPVVASLRLWATPDKYGGTGFHPFIEAGHKRARGKPLRRVTADMLEKRLVEKEGPADLILNQRVKEIFDAEERAFQEAQDSWRSQRKSQVDENFDVRGGMGAGVEYTAESKKDPSESEQDEQEQEPLTPKQRIRLRIDELRLYEEKKRSEEAQKWAAQYGISDITIEDKSGGDSEAILARILAANMYMPLDNVSAEKRNSSDEVDFLSPYPGLQQLREVIVKSTYDRIIRTAPDVGFRQEYLRNCVENGANTILISTIIEASQLRRASDPPLLVDAKKLADFQTAIREFGTSKINCPTLEEMEVLAKELDEELAKSPSKGQNLSTATLNVTKGYHGLKTALFTFENLVLKDGRGPMHLDTIDWSETVQRATLYGGLLAICALTQVLERQHDSQQDLLP